MLTNTLFCDYYRARYYDPAVGRFASEDPIQFRGDVNFYRYVRNSSSNATDPLGLYTPGKHYDMTYYAGLAVFGPKCEDKARRVAEADRAVDETHGFVDTLRLYTGRGEGWDKPGPHFPSPPMTNTQLSMAVSRCSPEELGRALHSLQDGFAHAALSPLGHKLIFTWDYAIQFWDHFAPNPLEDEAETETIHWMGEFKEKCLKCCQ